MAVKICIVLVLKYGWWIIMDHVTDYVGLNCMHPSILCDNIFSAWCHKWRSEFVTDYVGFKLYASFVTIFFQQGVCPCDDVIKGIQNLCRQPSALLKIPKRYHNLNGLCQEDNYFILQKTLCCIPSLTLVSGYIQAHRGSDEIWDDLWQDRTSECEVCGLNWQGIMFLFLEKPSGPIRFMELPL